MGWREKERERIERRQGKEELIKLQILSIQVALD